MSKYIRLFENHDEYLEYLNGGGMILPNVSHCIDVNDVHYNPWFDNRIVVTYYVEDISQPTRISGYQKGGDFDPIYPINNLKKIIIDNKIELLPSEVERATDEQWGFARHAIYQFDTIGEHTIQYVLNTEEYDDQSTGEIYREFNLPSALCKDCTEVVAVKFPEGIQYINGFSGCTNLSSVIIPDSVQEYGNSCFSHTKINPIYIPKQIQSIGNYCFSWTNPTSISVDSENPYFDSRNNCNAVIETATNKLVCGCTDTVIPQEIQSFSGGAFAGTDITSFITPSSVTEIPYSLCAGCTKLNNLSIGENVTIINMSAFNGCTALTNVTIPNSVKTISSYSFGDCTSLQTLTIGTGVTSIDYGAFDGCTGLTSITCLATTPPSGGRFMFRGSTCPIYVPSASVNAYKSKDSNWRDYASRIQPIQD